MNLLTFIFCRVLKLKGHFQMLVLTKKVHTRVQFYNDVGSPWYHEVLIGRIPLCHDIGSSSPIIKKIIKIRCPVVSLEMNL